MAGTLISPSEDSIRLNRDLKGRSLLSFPDDYAVIDLETTGLDPKFDEIIEIAGIKYSGEHEVRRFQSLVNPGFAVGKSITKLTGISNEMLATAPFLSSVLPDFFDFIGQSIVIGHNVNFDINFLYDNALNLSLPAFSNDFVDTMRLSRRLYKDMKNHKLSTLVSYLGVAESVEHRALSDCINTNECFLKMKQYAQTKNVSLDADLGRYHSPFKTIESKAGVLNPDSPIYGKSFAFTGSLERMIRSDAAYAVELAGGIACHGVVESTNYLVVANDDHRKAVKGEKSMKLKKAEKLRLSGHNIIIISEETFYDMLSTWGSADLIWMDK